MKNQSKKRTSEGKGQGTKDEYKPWVTIQDIPSTGIAARHSLEKKNNWLFRLIENPELEGNPIRHILLMLFLGIEFYFKINKDIK